MIEGRTRFLVHHDYGMGGLWWWIWAGSADEIMRTLAEVEVLTDPEILSWHRDVEEFDLDDVDGDPVLVAKREERDEQRGKPGFGVLVGKPRVFLRVEEDGVDYLVDYAPDGRWQRQVRIGEDGTLYRSEIGDWPINPPIDLYDPQCAEREIDESVFEEAWRKAAPDPDYED